MLQAFVLSAQPPSCGETRIATGSRISGAVSRACANHIRSGLPSTRYTFHGREGERITIRASSPAFWPELVLLDATSKVIARNTGQLPAEGGLLRLPSTGTFTVEVASSEPAATGAFSLELSAACASSTPIAFGQTVNGSLSNTDCVSDLGNFYTDYYTFSATAGQQISISMSSAVIDTYLVLNAPSGEVIAENDDISAGDLDSRIPPSGDFTAPASGTYTIQATSFGLLETGSYTLRLRTSGVAPQATGPFRFVPVTPCRLADTRVGEGRTGAFGPPSFTAGATRDIPIASGTCDIPSTARAYSFNITVVPRGPLSFLTVWPSGQARPVASTLNSFQGSIVANAAVVPAGANGAVSVYATDPTDVIIDINGYFVP